jgi:hypothetical protein
VAAEVAAAGRNLAVEAAVSSNPAAEEAVSSNPAAEEAAGSSLAAAAVNRDLVVVVAVGEVVSERIDLAAKK